MLLRMRSCMHKCLACAWVCVRTRKQYVFRCACEQSWRGETPDLSFTPLETCIFYMYRKPGLKENQSFETRVLPSTKPCFRYLWKIQVSSDSIRRVLCARVRTHPHLHPPTLTPHLHPHPHTPVHFEFLDARCCVDR